MEEFLILVSRGQISLLLHPFNSKSGDRTYIMMATPADIIRSILIPSCSLRNRIPLYV